MLTPLEPHVIHKLEAAARFRPTADPAMMRLPHPQRTMASPLKTVWSAILDKDYDRLVAMLNDDTLTLEQVATAMASTERFTMLRQVALGDSANINDGSLFLTLAALRYLETGNPHFQVTDALEAQLQQTDLGEELPARFFRTGYPAAYVEFGETRLSPLSVTNPVSGEHVLEGCYVQDHPVVAIPGENVPPYVEQIGICNGTACRVVELLFTGSPQGKEHFLDDSVKMVALYITDESESIRSLLDKHLKMYSRRWPQVDGEPVSEDDQKAFRSLIPHLAKVLLYINSTSPLRETLTPRKTLLRQLQNVKPKKQAKLKRQLVKAYDRILIGPKSAPGSGGDTAGESRRKPHWRRGHFRHQPYGPRSNPSYKIIYIEPVLVNWEAGKPPAPKSYRVR